MPDPSKPYDYENEWMLSEEQKEQYRERDRKWRELLKDIPPVKRTFMLEQERGAR